MLIKNIITNLITTCMVGIEITMSIQYVILVTRVLFNIFNIMERITIKEHSSKEKKDKITINVITLSSFLINCYIYLPNAITC